MPPNIDVLGFRYRNDDGNEAAATWIYAENADGEIYADTRFRFRFELDNDGTIFNDNLYLRYQLNGGGFNFVTGSSSVVRCVTSPNVSDGGVTTEQLTGSALAFVAGKIAAGQGSFYLVVDNNESTEVEAVIRIIDADVNPGDTIQLYLSGSDVDSAIPAIKVVGENLPVVFMLSVVDPHQLLIAVPLLVTFSVRPPVALNATSTAPSPVVLTFSIPAVPRVLTVGNVTLTFTVVVPTLVQSVAPDSVVFTFTVTAIQGRVTTSTVAWVFLVPGVTAKTVLGYSGLFEDIGEYVEAADNFFALAATIETAFQEVSVQLTTNTRFDLMSGLLDEMDNFKDDASSMSNRMITWARDRLLHYSTVLTILPLGRDANVLDVLPELYRSMVDDAQTIDASVVTVGVVVDDMVGDSDGAVFVSKVLDGESEPSLGFESCREYLHDLSNDPGSGRLPGEHAAYEGEYSQMATLNDDIVLTCISDYEDNEVFEWIGDLERRSPYDWKHDGSGRGPDVSVMNASGLVAGGEFETFASNVPSGWSITAGTAGTHVSSDTSVYKRGTGCLNLAGDGIQATIEIYQTLTGLTPGRRYVVGCWILGDAAIVAGVLSIQMAGTGYTSGTSGTEKERMQRTAAQLAAATVWEPRYFFFNCPLDIPVDFKLVIKVTGTLSNNTAIRVDGLAMSEAVYHNGVCIGILSGTEKFIEGDRFTFNVQNDQAGEFQEFFRKSWGFQLPSHAGGSETISDALCSD